MEPKFPNVTVKLVGEDGNAFAIIGRVTREMRRSGVDKTDIDAFREEAMSGHYDDLLRTCMNWVNVE